jgi:hypothetical protein
MALRFDVYLLGPEEGIEEDQFVKGLELVFGSLPSAVVEGLRQGPVKIKSRCGLELAQRYLESIRRIGGRVDLVDISDGTAPTAPSSVGSYGRGRQVTGPQKKVARRRAPSLYLDGAAESEGVPKERPLENMVVESAAGRHDIFLSIEAIGIGHGLRDDVHQLSLRSLSQLPWRALSYSDSIGLDLLAPGDADAQLSERLMERYALQATPMLFLPQVVDGDEGLVLTEKSIAWPAARIPLSRIQNVAIQCDAEDRVFLELFAADKLFGLVPAQPTSLLILACLIAAHSKAGRLWVSPRASRELWKEFSRLMLRLGREISAAGPNCLAAQQAWPSLRRFADLVEERRVHWQELVFEEYPSLKVIDIPKLLDMVVANEVLEVRDRLSEESTTICRELLLSAQSAIRAHEGVLALFELRADEWHFPSGMAPSHAGALLLYRPEGTVDLDTARTATSDTFLVGTMGILTVQRLLFLRPGGKIILTIDLEDLERVSVGGHRVPRLQLTYNGPFDERLKIDYVCSGNYVYPREGDPMTQLRRLVERILEAKAFVDGAKENPLRRKNDLPASPGWVTPVLESLPASCSERMAGVVGAWLNESATPEVVRRVAKVGEDIRAAALKKLRQRLEEAGASLNDLGRRLLFLPGSLFESDRDGVLITEKAILVSGCGSGRLDWADIRNLESFDNTVFISGAGLTLALTTEAQAISTFFVSLLASMIQARKI